MNTLDGENGCVQSVEMRSCSACNREPLRMVVWITFGVCVFAAVLISCAGRHRMTGKGWTVGYGQEELGQCRESAEKGYAPDQFLLGELLIRETGERRLAGSQEDVEAKYEIEAICNYRKGFERDYSPAPVNLADRPLCGEGVEAVKSEAAFWYWKAAEQGYAPAQHRYGVCLTMGKGVPRDDSAGEKWIKLAAEQGYAPAQVTLSYCTGGMTIPQYSAFVRTFHDGVDPRKHWKQDAANQGYAPAQFRIGNDLRDEGADFGGSPEALDWYRKAAAQGHAYAMAEIGFSYYFGKNGEEQDTAEARRWFEKAVGQCGADIDAVCNAIGDKIVSENDVQEYVADLGEKLCYCSDDVSEMIYWYRKAAEHGDASAQYRLGRCLLVYRFCGSDSDALCWLRLSRYPDVKKLKGCLTREDVAEPMRWLHKAADQGHKDAQKFIEDLER